MTIRTLTERTSDHILISIKFGKALEIKTTIKWNKHKKTVEAEEYWHKSLDHAYKLEEKILKIKSKIVEAISKFKNKKTAEKN